MRHVVRVNQLWWIDSNQDEAKRAHVGGTTSYRFIITPRENKVVSFLDKGRTFDFFFGGGWVQVSVSVKHFFPPLINKADNFSDRKRCMMGAYRA